MSDRETTPGASFDITARVEGVTSAQVAVNVGVGEVLTLRGDGVVVNSSGSPILRLVDVHPAGTIGAWVRVPVPGPDVSRIRSSARAKGDIKPVPKAAPKKGGRGG